MEFTIKRTSKNYLVIRVNGEYNQHAHFTTKENATKFIEFMRKNKMPKKKYYKEAAKRVLTEDEFDGLIVSKRDKYYNVTVKKSVRHYD